MLRINKASEYGLLALSHIESTTQALSAREIAEGLELPYEITAKTLQKLKEAGFIESSMGTNGGYRLLRPLTQISFAQVIDALEGPIAVVECVDHSDKVCSRNGTCHMSNGMQRLNYKIRELLESISLKELASEFKGDLEKRS